MGSVGILLIMTGHERDVLVSVACATLLGLGLTAALIPPLGVEGAAIGRVASLVTWNVALTILTYRRIGIRATALAPPIMSRAKNLDFLLVGAQKAGTTSLFEYVRLHPGLHLPSEKEVSYFNIESRVERGWPWYLGWVFADAPTDRPWGTFSTFYMDAAEGREDTVPRRIRETVPDVQLIAILRDPVARASPITACR